MPKPTPKHLVFIILSAAILLGSGFSLYAWWARQNQAVLTILTSPIDASIAIDGKPVGLSPLNAPLPRRVHTITASLDGYKTATKTLTLTQDTTVTIAFEPNSLVIPAEHNQSFKTTAGQVVDNSLIYFDAATQSLMLVTGSSSASIYQGNVQHYSYVYPAVALIDAAYPDSIIYLDVSSKQTSRISVPSLRPLEGIALDRSLSHLYILGNHSASRRQSVLFASPVSGKNPERLITTSATALQSAPSPYVALFAEADGDNKSIIELYNTSAHQSVLKVNGNSFQFSPSGQYLAINGTQLSIYDMGGDPSTPSASLTRSFYAWTPNNELVTAKNRFPGVDALMYSPITNSSHSISVPSFQNTTIIKLVGIAGDFLVALSKEGTIITGKIEE